VFSCDFNIKMLLFELDFEEVSKKKLCECWSQLCRIRCSFAYSVLLRNIRVNYTKFLHRVSNNTL